MTMTQETADKLAESIVDVMRKATEHIPMAETSYGEDIIRRVFFEMFQHRFGTEFTYRGTYESFFYTVPDLVMIEFSPLPIFNVEKISLS
jgi:hypothetical protein